MSDFKKGDRVRFTKQSTQGSVTGTFIRDINRTMCEIMYDGEEVAAWSDTCYVELDHDAAKLEAQTLQFWHLQLQFLEIPVGHIAALFAIQLSSPYYRRNKHTKRLESKFFTNHKPTTKDVECLATHLAMQLAGIEE